MRSSPSPSQCRAMGGALARGKRQSSTSPRAATEATADAACVTVVVPTPALMSDSRLIPRRVQTPNRIIRRQPTYNPAQQLRYHRLRTAIVARHDALLPLVVAACLLLAVACSKRP